jgi:hypothetical protein
MRCWSVVCAVAFPRRMVMNFLEPPRNQNSVLADQHGVVGVWNCDLIVAAGKKGHSYATFILNPHQATVAFDVDNQRRVFDFNNQLTRL